MSDRPILKATPRFEKSVAAIGPAIFMSITMVLVVVSLGFVIETAYVLAFVLLFGGLLWFPVGLFAAYMNRPTLALTEQGIAVQPEHQLVRARMVPFEKCRWAAMAQRRITFRLFPIYYSMTKMGSLPHRLIIDVSSEQFDVWVTQLRASGAPEEGPTVHPEI